MKSFLSLLVCFSLLICLSTCFTSVADAQQCNVQSNSASSAASSAAAVQQAQALQLLQQLSQQRTVLAPQAIVSSPVTVRQFAVPQTVVVPSASASAGSAVAVQASTLPPTFLSTVDGLNSLALLQQLSAVGVVNQPSASASAASSSGGGRGRILGSLPILGGRSFSRSVSVSRSR